MRNETAKGDVGKHVSAFANAGGGTLIYGIKEDSGHIAIEIDEGYDPKDIRKEWLEDVIRSQIQRRIEGIEIIPVWLDVDKERVLYVVEIPQSQRAPHQASNKKFYIRRNFGISAMEEYEIRDVFMRSRAPNVILDLYLSRHKARIETFEITWGDIEHRYQMEFNGALLNEGGGEVHYMFITLIADERLIQESDRDLLGFRKLQAKVDGRTVDILRTDIKWGGPARMPLFRTVEYGLLKEDVGIQFKRKWLEDEFKPFIGWETRAAGMLPNIGMVELRKKENGVTLARIDAKEISEITQDGRDRDFLRNPDLSIDPSL